MNSDLEKIDLIRARMGVSYKEAKDALEAAGGDVVQALIALEERGRNLGERVQARGNELYGQIKNFLSKGQEYRIKIKKGDKVVYEVPASVGALGILAALASSEVAILGALGTMTAMANNYTLEIEKQGEQEKKTDAAGANDI
ncbi:MAG: DUF4342 domain-containing protein [Firmicutes bacterium]|nr:DUF4342 domain-containing protein [Bacillota bacterium]